MNPVRLRLHYETMRKLAEEIKEYTAHQKIQMLQADFAIKAMLSSDWIGSDAREFEKKWSGVDDKDSEATNFSNALVKFNQILANCANIYRITQETAINRVGSLYNSIINK